MRERISLPSPLPVGSKYVIECRRKKRLGIDSPPRGFAERPARRASTCSQQQYPIEIEARPLHPLRSWSTDMSESTA
jgi:hypothetical protein